jgi:hypothetical protein
MVAAIERPDLLAQCGLPRHYRDLSLAKRREARLRVMRSWFDPSQPEVLCTDVKAYLRAHRLFVEFYLKPDPHNSATYWAPDPLHKYEMLRAAMNPAKVVTEPTKMVAHAPRGTVKTITFVHESQLLVALFRPKTELIMSQHEGRLTAERMDITALQVQNNRNLAADLGGLDQIIAKKGGKLRWNQKRLDFAHNNSSITGVSCLMKHRGRHPLYGVIDDPEEIETSRNPEWRKKYFNWLFRTYLPMFAPGGHVVWIATPPAPFCCLHMALAGISRDETEDDLDAEEQDQRFEDWYRCKFKAIREDDDGNLYSIMPEKISVDGFEAKKAALGLAATLSEYQGEQIAEGSLVFARDDFRHGYMRCLGGEGTGQRFYMLDLRTGQMQDWDKFLESLSVFQAVDIADSVATHADPAAIVVIGISPEGVVYVLDVWIRRTKAEDLIQRAFNMALFWGAQQMGWEREALASVVCRQARTLGNEIREQGGNPPIHRDIRKPRIAGAKVRKILGMLMPVISREQIRFPYFREYQAPDGTRHWPYKNNNRGCHAALKQEVDGFTDEGASGHDDGIDALAMALELARGARGAHAPEEDHNEMMVRAWQEAGVTVDRRFLPFECWTKDMWQEHQEALYAPAEDAYAGWDPYE